MVHQMATAPALWNQLRFNTDQPPILANLVSQPAAARPGAILLGPDTQKQFVFADSETLELAQRLARRDVAKMRDSAPVIRSKSPVAQASHPRSTASPSPPPARPVQRLCKTVTKPAVGFQKRAHAAEERRLKQQEQLRKRREAEEADLKKRREAREKAAAAAANHNTVRNANRTRVQQLQISENVRNELPIRGDSPPVRDTDPQLVEIREQHNELMGMLRELIHMNPKSSNKKQTRPRVGSSHVARAVAGSSNSARSRGYLSQTRASKNRQQRPARRRQVESPEIEEEIEERYVQPMRLLNSMPMTQDNQRYLSQDSIASENRQAVLRNHLSNRLGVREVIAPKKNDVSDALADLLLDEVVGDAAANVHRIETNSLPGYNDTAEEFLEPTVDELDFRLQQIESEYDAIRQRWRGLTYEDVPMAESQSEIPNPLDACITPLTLENKAMLFTKRSDIHEIAAGAVDKPRLLPRPPKHVTIGLSRASLRSINKGCQRYQDWIADRPGPRFSVDLATVADWICADLVDEAMNEGIQDLDKATEDILQLMLEGEVAGEELEPEESTLADGEDYINNRSESSSLFDESGSESIMSSESDGRKN